MKQPFSLCHKLVYVATLPNVMTFELILMVSLFLFFWFNLSAAFWKLNKYTERPDQTMYSQIRVMCYTNNIDDIKSYYLEVLELDIFDSWDSGVMFEIGDNIIEYFVGESSPKTFAISIEVDDVDGLWNRMRRHTNWVYFEIRDNPWGDRSFGLKDPNGSQIVFFSKY